MKKERLGLLVRSLFLLALAMVFVVSKPIVIEAANGEVVIDCEFNETDVVISKLYDTVLLNEGFTTEGGITYNIDAQATLLSGTGLVEGTEIKIVVEEDSVGVIEPISEGHWEVTDPGYYTIVISVAANPNLPTSPIPRVSASGWLKVETQGMPKYNFFKVEKKDVVEDINTYTIAAGAANYQGYSDLGRLFYVKDHYTGKFKRMGELTSVATESNRVTIKGNRGKTYTVYVVNRGIATKYANEVPLPIGGGESDWFKLTTEQQTKLKEISQYKQISTKAPAVGKIKNLSNKKGVTTAKLSWTVVPRSNGSYPNITGYQIKRYNAAGEKLLKTYTYTKLKNNSGEYKSKITTGEYYTPYKGYSVYKVTPYYKYLGKTYYGATKTIKVQSKALSATGTTGNAVKITNNKSGFSVNMENGATGIGVFQKKGDKWVLLQKKKVDPERGWIYFTLSKTGVGKKSVRFKSYVVDQNKTYWSPLSKKTYSQRKNQVTIGSSDNVTDYPWLEVTKVRTKIWYDGDDLKIKYRVVNRDSKQKIAVQTTLVAENMYSGKFTTVGKSNKKYVTLAYGEQAFVTVTIKNAKKVDLVNSILR